MVSKNILYGLALMGFTSCTVATDKVAKQVIVDPSFTMLATDDFRPLAQPRQLWQMQAGAILDNNGVYVSPDGAVVVSTAENGNVHAFDPQTGQERWVYTPPNEDASSVRCFSGVQFSYTSPTPYMVYSVVNNPNSLEPDTRVIALSPEGEELWTSLNLEGVASGTPVVSYDGRYVYLTHNSNQISVGHFTVLDTEAVEQGYVLPLYSEFNRTNPFAPPGIYHAPAEGYYDGGQYNTNDIVIWSYAPRPTDITAGTGAAFVFQMPMTLNTDITSVYWLLLGDEEKDWQSISAPVITNQGRSLYWGVSRSQYRAWVGQQGRNQYRFNRGRTASANFDRGTPRFQSIYNTPALSSDPVQPLVFGGSASTQFIKMDYLLNVLQMQNTSTVVKAQAKITPNDEFIYYTEFGGTFHMAHVSNLSDHIMVDTFSNLDGDFAMSPDGSVVYLGELSGRVTALQVARVPTRAPTAPPTLAPVVPPPTRRPVPAPTDPPVDTTEPPLPVMAEPQQAESESNDVSQAAQEFIPPEQEPEQESSMASPSSEYTPPQEAFTGSNTNPVTPVDLQPLTSDFTANSGAVFVSITWLCPMVAAMVASYTWLVS